MTINLYEGYNFTIALVILTASVIYLIVDIRQYPRDGIFVF